MRFGRSATAALAVLALGATGVSAAVADNDDYGHNRQSIDTRAEYTPGSAFTPVASSTACPGEPGGRQANPFAIPPGYDQTVVAEETDPVPGPFGGQEDLYDMNTQNEFGTDAGRYVFRTHEVGAARNAGDPPRSAGGSQVSVTDLKTGVTKNVAERNDWERFDGLVWTPWGTILAAEETITASAKDPNVPQANGGLVYELFPDKDDPSKLDPSREPITPGDGTNDTTKDGIRARPALGAKSHEGMRFDKRGNHYGIAESRGQTTANQSGAIYRFVPDRKGDLSRGQLQALQTDDRRYGEGRWVNLDRTAVQVDADREAEQKGANEYQRPEDVETGESTGKDRQNGGQTVYVAVTEGAEGGVLAIDTRQRDRPFVYQYAAHTADYTNSDNLALDRDGNLAITEDPPGNPVGADIWIAEPPKNGGKHEPAGEVARFASLKDCEAEPSGIYFAMQGTEKWARQNPALVEPELVNSETLFVNRMHSGETTVADQLVAISPSR